MEYRALVAFIALLVGFFVGLSVDQLFQRGHVADAQRRATAAQEQIRRLEAEKRDREGLIQRLDERIEELAKQQTETVEKLVIGGQRYQEALRRVHELEDELGKRPPGVHPGSEGQRATKRQ